MLIKNIVENVLHFLFSTICLEHERGMQLQCFLSQIIHMHKLLSNNRWISTVTIKVVFKSVLARLSVAYVDLLVWGVAMHGLSELRTAVTVTAHFSCF